MSETLARVTAFAYDPPAIPDDVLDYAATLLIDTLGVAAGAVPMQAGRIARDHAARFLQATGKDAAPMLFDGRGASLTGAAWALRSSIRRIWVSHT